jgi:hypothetical protein
MGSKIAALQAGFMSDLNKRLKLGPQAPPSSKSQQEGSPEAGDEEGQATAAPKEKVPLSDARKGRARGPQRRAPAAAAAAAKAAVPSEGKVAEKTKAVSGFVAAVTFFEIDPDEGVLTAGVVEKAQPEPKLEAKAEPEVVAEEAKVEKPKTEELKTEEPKVEEPKTEELPVKETTDEVAARPTPAVSLPSVGKEEREEAQVTAESEKEEVSEPKTTPESEAEEKPEPEAATSGAEPEPQLEVKTEAAPGPESVPEPEPEKQEIKSLATNMAGETLIKEEVKTDEEHGEVEPVKVVEN